jgi:hypothetical protein
MQNATTVQGGKYGKAFNFPWPITGTGNTDISTSATSSLNMADGDNFTLMAWVYYQGLNQFGNAGTIVGKFNCCTASEYRIYVNNSNQLVLSLTDDSGSGNDTYLVTSSLTVTKNTWVHVAATFDDASASNINLYINGVKDPSPTRTGTLANIGSFNTSTGIHIGGNFYSFGGKIDDVKIYKYVRSQAQVTEDMNGGHPAPGSPVGTPLGYWRFDEGYSTTANNVGSLGNSGSTYTGTLTNMSSPATSTSGWTNNGKFGKGLLFDGTNDRVDYSDMTVLEGISQATWSMWVNPTSLSTSQGILVKANNAFFSIHHASANEIRIY